MAELPRRAPASGSFTCESVVVATGGLSIPKMGATAFGYELAKQFGHSIVEPRAGLVPLVFSVEDKERWCDLAGLSTEVIGASTLSAKKPLPRFREKLLVTHRGVSGPAVLQVSSYWQPGGEVSFDLAPGLEVFQPLHGADLGARLERGVCSAARGAAHAHG